jgi:hypothetical protein
MQIALGGAERIAAIRDLDQTVQAATWNTDGSSRGTVWKRVRWIRPNYLRLDQEGPGDTYVLYFDGMGGWEILPDKSVRDLASGELTFARNYLRGLDLNFWLADRDPDNMIQSSAMNVIAITSKSNPGNTTEITLDPVTFLPIKQTSTSHADPNHPVPAEVQYDQWQTVDGVRFPGRIRNFHNGRMLAEITTTRTSVNSGLKSSDLATKPSDLNPVVTDR